MKLQTGYIKYTFKYPLEGKEFKDVKIPLYGLTKLLYDELNSFGLIERMDKVPQLGIIKARTTSKNKKKTTVYKTSRLDYILLQLWLHNFVKDSQKIELYFSYNNRVSPSDFGNSIKNESLIEYWNNNYHEFTVGSMLQLLTISYNIGHLFATFTSSRASLLCLKKNELYKNLLLNANKDERFKTVLDRIIENEEYLHFHLLNSLILLNKCDQTNQAVQMTQEILYAYLNNDWNGYTPKVNDLFGAFKSIRNLSFIAYDLPASSLPFRFDLSDAKGVEFLLSEVLNKYNDHSYSENLIQSINKLLNDSIYNKSSQMIINYQTAKAQYRSIQRQLNQNWDYYENINHLDSCINKPPNISIRIDENNILKLTFDDKEAELTEFKNILYTVTTMNFVREGYYNRFDGRKTLVLGIDSCCPRALYVALKVGKKVISSLLKAPIEPDDSRFLLIAKFILYYLFDNNNLEIKSPNEEMPAVVCIRGSSRRIKYLDNILHSNKIFDEDKYHEIESMYNYLSKIDKGINDTALLIPSSTIVKHKTEYGKELCELDGIIIFPNRKEEQIVLLEAKNIKLGGNKAKKALKSKLEKINRSTNMVSIFDKDAYVKISI